MLVIPDPATLTEARVALQRLVRGLHWPGGEAPPLYTHAVEALRRVEDALGEPHTVPTRRARRGCSEEARYGHE